MEQTFKGGKFFNRYKITATLTAKSPIHVGDGSMVSDPARLAPSKEDQKDESWKFTTVMTDAQGRAYIPGSTLKGNLRSWLTQIFGDLSLAALNDPSRAKLLRDVADEIENEKKAKAKIHGTLNMTEYLFGSAINEGKLEIWDAYMQTPPPYPNTGGPKASAGYDQTRGTILLKSVAIDPVSGTAEKNKLFNYEVVPEGARFELNISGQNLTPEELGMLLFAIDGFNSKIYPVTLGAMGSIGFGRVNTNNLLIFRLDEGNFDQWLKGALANGHAGYENLPVLTKTEQEKKIEEFTKQFSAKL